MNIRCLAFLSLWLTYGCAEPNNQHAETSASEPIQDSVFLTVRYDQPDAGSLDLLYINDMNDRVLLESRSADSSSEFRMPASAPVFLLEWVEHENYYIVFPGEKVSIQPAQGNAVLHASSSMANRENEWRFFEELRKVETGELNIIPETLQEAEDRYQRSVSFLKKYTKDHPVSERFTQLVASYFRYAFRAAVFSHLNSPRFSTKKSMAELEKAYGFRNEDFSCDTCLHIPSYQKAAKAYADFLFRKNNADSLHTRFSLVKGAFTGHTREYVLFLLLKEQLNGQKDVPVALHDAFTSINKNKAYQQYIDEKIRFRTSNWNSAMAQNTFLKNNKGERNSFQAIMQQKNAKLILIDFWASWCKSCVKGIPFSKKLAQQYDKDGFVVVFLSMDQNEDNWKAYEKRLSLEQNSFVVENDFDAPLAKNFKFQGIPRYILLSSNGKILNDKAPRPEDPALEEMIRGYLALK